MRADLAGRRPRVYLPNRQSSEPYIYSPRSSEFDFPSRSEHLYVLGLSAFSHDPAAALLTPKGVEAAIEESKLVRDRNCSGVPQAAIRFCLEKGGIGWKDVDCVAVASRPISAWLRQAWMRAKRAPLAPIAAAYFQSKALGELSRDFSSLRHLKSMDGAGPRRVVGLEHHLCHAASAFYASPFDRALIVTLDEEGDGWSGLVSIGEGENIRPLFAIPFPHSLGWVYSQITDLIGFVPRLEEHKTQWMSLGAQPVFESVFREMLYRRPNFLPRLDFSYFNRGLAGKIAFSKKFYARLGLSAESPSSMGETLRRVLAGSIQKACTSVVSDMVEFARRKTASRQLCLAGGLFQNAVLVADLEKASGFNQIFVQPAAGNAGTALGAAWLAWRQVLNQPRPEPVLDLYWGPSYSRSDIKLVLDNCKVRYGWNDTEAQKIDETLRHLESGDIVAWYQGAAEFGPRALGNRSLLASPWGLYVKENLNQYVKNRESFRPFAIAVCEEDAAPFFDCSTLARFMTSLGWVRPGSRELLKEFLLPGDRVRLHLVERRTNHLFWKLLKKFGEHAPAPFLVNTSFNLFGEPLVLTPRDAVRSFFCSGIDALVIDNFILKKS